MSPEINQFITAVVEALEYAVVHSSSPDESLSAGRRRKTLLENLHRTHSALPPDDSGLQEALEHTPQEND